MKNAWLLFFLLLTLFTNAQDDNALPERKAYKLSLPVDKGTVYEMDVPSTPYVQAKNIVQIYPGEKLLLEAVEVDGALILTSVKEMKNPEKTISITCSQIVNNGRHEQIILKVINPFSRDLIYSAKMLLMNSKKWVDTSIIPVGAKLLGIETWPDMILSFGLAGWKLK